MHIRCAASSAQNLQHVGGCAHSLRCQHISPLVPSHTIPLVAAAVHILCAASKTGSPDIFLNMQSVPAVHILCAASIHHGRIRSMLLSFCVECICCAHSLCCQQAASRMPPLCTFAVLPAARKIFSTSVAVHILCAASTYHRWYHRIQFRWSLLLCTSSVLPARHAHQTFSQYAVGACCAHSLCCQHTSRPHM